MKQKDIAIIIAVVGFAAIFSYLVVSKFVVPAKNFQQEVEVVEKISPDFNVPDSKNFNEQSKNPTKLIRIAPNSNDQPFVAP